MRSFFPSNRQGIAIDAIAIACNLTLFPILAKRIEQLFTGFFGDDASAVSLLPAIMLLILVGRVAGLYLKRFPLQSRLADSDGGKFPLFFFVFSFPLLIVTAVFTAVGLAGWAADSGLMIKGSAGRSSTDSRAIEYAGSFVPLILAFVEAFLLYRLGRPLNDRERELLGRGSWIFSWGSELIADFGLFAYMMIWQVFYFQIAKLLTTRADGQPMSWDMAGVSVFFMAVCFMLFYVSPRAAFLIEDRKYRGTWLMIGLVFLTSLRELF